MRYPFAVTSEGLTRIADLRDAGHLTTIVGEVLHHAGRVLGAEGVGLHGAFGDQANGAQHLDPYEAAMRF